VISRVEGLRDPIHVPYLDVAKASESRDSRAAIDGYGRCSVEILERSMRRSQGEEASLCEVQAEKAAMLQCNPAFWPQRNTTGQIGAETALPSGNTVLVGVDIPEELVLVLVRTVVYAIFLLSVLSTLKTASSQGQWRWKIVTLRIAGAQKP
jgi:hypothetical protein